MATRLPVKIERGGKVSEGFCTPQEDIHCQRVSVPPRRVLPIIFLPGIMGSNLRLTAERQELLKHKNNIAWRPDRSKEMAALLITSPADRQLQLDPNTTEVDVYDCYCSSDFTESGDERNPLKGLHVDTPLLTDDPPTAADRKSKMQKARERGWGEVFFSSYRPVLEACEQRLNWSPSWSGWQEIVDVDPVQWQANKNPPLSPLSKKDIEEALKGCWFPVHAMGYNWLQSNGHSAKIVKTRISSLIEKYNAQGFKCEKVIIVTHSMGGLVARALIHPKIGNFSDTVLGVVHGVMPALGAPAAYRRMRCGFEEGFFRLGIEPKVLGNYGYEVTPVLGNAPGGLELLPSELYGNEWLQIRRAGKVLKSLPEKGDPYEEIYKLKDKWYGLLRADWLNPARVDGRGFENTCELLDQAKLFHRTIASSYHDQSYAHYGADPARSSWAEITWDLSRRIPVNLWEVTEIALDDARGNLLLNYPLPTRLPDDPVRYPEITLGPSTGAGDQTVPIRSADHQLRSGKFKGIFRQTGYEHQGSYAMENAINSTLFSLVNIIRTMRWSSEA